MEQAVDTWEYRDSTSATLHETFCPTCGQECEAAALRGNLWHGLVTFIASAVAASEGSVDVKRVFQQHEKRLSRDVLAQINKRSTFRVQKYVLAKCVAAGIPLLKPNGKPKGKTQLERELAQCFCRKTN